MLLISELLDHHWNEIIAIPPEMTRGVKDNLFERLCQCLDNNGKHFTDKMKWCHLGVIDKTIDDGIVVSEFELQSRYYVPFSDKYP